MKSQLISNYPFSDALDNIKIPDAVIAEMEKRGISAKPIPVKPMIDTGFTSRNASLCVNATFRRKNF